MKKAIVTGANGFVGAAVCKELIRRGIEVIAAVRNRNGDLAHIKAMEGVRIVSCDFSQPEKFADFIPDRDVDAMFHFAWEGSAGPLRGDADVQIRNVRYACSAVELCSVVGCRRFIFASSITEYEAAAEMAEGAVPGIHTLYGIAKTAANCMARAVAGLYGIEYIRAVISNIYGPGELSTRLINTSLRKMLNGVHCAFSDGRQLYDFVYVTDAAGMFAEIGEKGKANKTYYIGSQNPRPLKEFLLEMRDCVDPAIEIGLGEIPSHGISLTYREFDRMAIRDDTGFVPSVSFSEGIKKTIAWLREAG